MVDRPQPQDALGAEKPGDLDKVVTSVREHPLQYAAGLLVVVGAGLGFMFYSTSVQARSEGEATELLRAVAIEDATERVSTLASVVEGSTGLAAEALYLKAESEFADGDYEGARRDFAHLVEEYPRFQFAPDAIEGLGFAEEALGNYEAAISHYLDVQAKYPQSYAARRQHYNLGRAYAAQDKIKDAIDSYRRQVGEFPDSAVAARAQHQLHTYRASHPELFQQFEDLFSAPSEADTGAVELVTVPDDGETNSTEPGAGTTSTETEAGAGGVDNDV